MKRQNEAVLRRNNKTTFWLSIALCIVSALLIISTVLWLVNMNRNNSVSAQMENVYQRNFYDLIDNVNNAEVKLGKVLASDYDSYTEKMLSEISKNANSASYNLSNLPISLNGIDETKKFINQVGGYTDSLAQKLDRGEKLTQAELDTLEDIHYSIVLLKDNLAEFNDQIMTKGYNIFKEGSLVDGDYNNFTLKIQGVKTSDVEYPTMIYDGPFSDSEYNKEIKGLNANEVT
ncbi:MAG: germination protein YpeB, partial [Clostridia bacterium]|nr:germination protein YpeB [Clostridia bacterium]